MFLLYNGNESGSPEARLVSKVHSVKWELLKRNVARILRTLIHDVDAANLLEKMPFELWEGANGFGDQFDLLYMKVPVETYQEIELEADSYPAKVRYESIAQAMEQAGNKIRFIGMDANTDDLRIIPTPDGALTASPTFGDPDDRKFSRLAIEEARKSVPEDDRVHPRVGVVVVKDGRILASAHRGEISQCHAEYIALEKKLTDVSLLGATVYTTLEPCTARKHPKVPCAIRLTERKVTRVVIGMLDPDDRISGRGQRTLRKAGIATELFPHELMAEVEELNRDFVRDRESRESHLRDAPEREEGLAASVKPTAPPKLRVALKRGHVSNFLIEYTNDEDGPIFIREARLFGGKDGKIELTEPLTPDDPSTWRVAPHSSMTFGKTIVHQRNPAASLVKMNSNKGIFFETEMVVVVSCEMKGQLFEIRQTLYVKVNGTNNEIVPLV